VLQKFIRERKNLKRLRVFTFRNPSYDWDFPDVYTEHFANKEDFVAQLGVLRDGRNYRGTIFKNTSWTGHLFGAQYSLDPGDYEGDLPENDPRISKLLTCAGGTDMS
jgi:hypothetical protein